MIRLKPNKTNCEWVNIKQRIVLKSEWKAAKIIEITFHTLQQTKLLFLERTWMNYPKQLFNSRNSKTTKPLNTLELWRNQSRIECQAAIFRNLWLWHNHLWKAWGAQAISELPWLTQKLRTNYGIPFATVTHQHHLAESWRTSDDSYRLPSKTEKQNIIDPLSSCHMLSSIISRMIMRYGGCPKFFLLETAILSQKKIYFSQTFAISTKNFRGALCWIVSGNFW